MRIGIPKEVKSDEYRVGMMPVGVAQCVKAGHQVFVETNAGIGSGFADDDYAKAGGVVLPAISTGDLYSSFCTCPRVLSVRTIDRGSCVYESMSGR